MSAATAILHESRAPGAAHRPTAPVSSSVAWHRADLSDRDGIIELDEASLDELDAVIATLRANPLAIELLESDAFDLDACRRLMTRARTVLDDGVGFVIIDRLPLDRYSKADATAAHWLLSQLVSRPVAQNWSGKLIYDVRDFGRPPGNGIRPDVTNAEQHFHTDNSYNLCPPDYVSLLCLRPAKEGGVSSIVSFYSVFNQMLSTAPDLVGRLFEPYLFDRNKEHAPDAAPIISHPLMEMDGAQLRCRLSHGHVVNGYRMAGIAIDSIGEAALHALEATMREPQFAREFFFEPGQIQILDNRRIGHRRTGFVDYDEEEEEDRKRHLVRLWLRDRGRRFYNG